MILHLAACPISGGQYKGHHQHRRSDRPDRHHSQAECPHHRWDGQVAV